MPPKKTNTPKEQPLYVSSTPPKSNSGLMVVIIIIVALVAGGGVYYWQSLNIAKQSQAAAEKVRNEMQQKITEAETKTTELQNKLAEQQKTIDDLTLLKNSPNLVNVSNARVGDVVVGMTITSIGKVNTSAPDDLSPNYEITFNGQTTIAGNFTHSEFSGDYMFTVNPTDEIKLPRATSDRLPSVLCLNNVNDPSNDSAIKKIVEKNNGAANITIADYTISGYPTEVCPMAKIIKINP